MKKMQMHGLHVLYAGLKSTEKVPGEENIILRIRTKDIEAAGAFLHEGASAKAGQEAEPI